MALPSTNIGSEMQSFRVAAIFSLLGLLLPEFIMSLTLLHLEDNHKLLNSSVSSLQSWLQILDQFNGLAQGSAKEDQDDLSWPGMAKYQTSKKHDSGEAFEVPMIRKGKVFFKIQTPF